MLQTQKCLVFFYFKLFFSITEYTSCPQRKVSTPEHCLKIEKWQGPPNVNKIKHLLSCDKFSTRSSDIKWWMHTVYLKTWQEPGHAQYLSKIVSACSLTRISINMILGSVGRSTAFQLQLEPGTLIKTKPKHSVCGGEACVQFVTACISAPELCCNLSWSMGVCSGLLARLLWPSSIQHFIWGGVLWGAFECFAWPRHSFLTEIAPWEDPCSPPPHEELKHK